MLKRISFFFFILALACLLFTACDDDDDKKNNSGYTIEVIMEGGTNPVWFVDDNSFLASYTPGYDNDGIYRVIVSSHESFRIEGSENHNHDYVPSWDREYIAWSVPGQGIKIHNLGTGTTSSVFPGARYPAWRMDYDQLVVEDSTGQLVLIDMDGNFLNVLSSNGTRPKTNHDASNYVAYLYPRLSNGNSLNIVRFSNPQQSSTLIGDAVIGMDFCWGTDQKSLFTSIIPSGSASYSSVVQANVNLVTDWDLVGENLVSPSALNNGLQLVCTQLDGDQLNGVVLVTISSGATSQVSQSGHHPVAAYNSDSFLYVDDEGIFLASK